METELLMCKKKKREKKIIHGRKKRGKKKKKSVTSRGLELTTTCFEVGALIYYITVAVILNYIVCG